MARRPETRRKIPNYFGDCSALRLDWSNQGWAVRFWCEQLKRWDWTNLETQRVGKKLKAEAKAAAVQLMRDSVVRWEAERDRISAVAARLSLEANRIESGEMDWSAL